MEYNLADLFEAAVDAFPEREYLIAEGERRTYAEMEERANRMAHHLAAHGVGPGDHVGVEGHRTRGEECGGHAHDEVLVGDPDGHMTAAGGVGDRRDTATDGDRTDHVTRLEGQHGPLPPGHGPGPGTPQSSAKRGLASWMPSRTTSIASCIDSSMRR